MMIVILSCLEEILLLAVFLLALNNDTVLRVVRDAQLAKWTMKLF